MCFDPPSEGHVLARNRTWSSTFAKSCARPSHSEDFDRNEAAREPPTRESNPALRLRRPPCVRHTRGETAECPRQESNLVFDLRGVACRPSHAEGKVEADGRSRTGMNLLTRQAPHRSATSARAGAQGVEPCPRVLEARCSPRSTPLKVSPARLASSSICARFAVRVSGGGRTRRLELHGLACSRYTTDTIGSVAGSTGPRRSGRGGSRTRKAHRSPALQAGPVNRSGSPSISSLRVGDAGVEPAASSVSCWRSGRLS